MPPSDENNSFNAFPSSVNTLTYFEKPMKLSFMEPERNSRSETEYKTDCTKGIKNIKSNPISHGLIKR